MLARSGLGEVLLQRPTDHLSARAIFQLGAGIGSLDQLDRQPDTEVDAWHCRAFLLDSRVAGLPRSAHGAVCVWTHRSAVWCGSSVALALFAFHSPLLAFGVARLADDEFAALDLLCDAIEASLPLALDAEAVAVLVGQPCNSTRRSPTTTRRRVRDKIGTRLVPGGHSGTRRASTEPAQ
jgi:hypothetical protein